MLRHPFNAPVCRCDTDLSEEATSYPSVHRLNLIIQLSPFRVHRLHRPVLPGRVVALRAISRRRNPPLRRALHIRAPPLLKGARGIYHSEQKGSLPNLLYCQIHPLRRHRQSSQAGAGSVIDSVGYGRGHRYYRQFAYAFVPERPCPGGYLDYLHLHRHNIGSGGHSVIGEVGILCLALVRDHLFI